MTPTPRPPVRGYQKKPLAIAVIAAIFFCLPGLLLLQVWMLSGGSWRAMLEVARSGYFVNEWWMAWSAAAAVWIVSRWTFIYFLGLSAYVLIAKTSALLTHPHLETPLSLLVTACWLGATVWFLVSSLKMPYLNPKLRWWTRPMRVTTCREAMLRYRGSPLPVTVLNLSLRGAFVRFKETALRTRVLPQRLGDTCVLTASLIRRGRSHVKPWRFHAPVEVVWRATPDSPYRDGMGLRFVSLSRPQRWQLRRFLRDEAASPPPPVV